MTTGNSIIVSKNKYINVRFNNECQTVGYFSSQPFALLIRNALAKFGRSVPSQIIEDYSLQYKDKLIRDQMIHYDGIQLQEITLVYNPPVNPSPRPCGIIIKKRPQRVSNQPPPTPPGVSTGSIPFTPNHTAMGITPTSSTASTTQNINTFTNTSSSHSSSLDKYI